MKHTPGPHEVIGTTVYALEFDSWCKGVEQMRNRIWANVQGYKDTPKEEVEATARLYAAAPDMLEALLAATDCGMVPISSASEGGASRHSAQVRAADMIRAAIAKATGAV